MNVAQGQSGAQNMGHMTSAGYLGQARVMLQTVHILTSSHQPRSAYNMVTGVWPSTVMLSVDIMIEYTSVEFGLPSIDN